MHRTLAVLALLTFSAAAEAQETKVTLIQETKVALIEEMLVLTRMEEITTISQTEGFKLGITMADSPIPESKKEQILAAGMEAMADIMPWSAVKQDYVTLYSEHYTEEELKEIIELCKDPRYKKMIAKQVELIRPSLEIGQKYGQRLGAKMMETTMKIMLEP